MVLAQHRFIAHGRNADDVVLWDTPTDRDGEAPIISDRLPQSNSVIYRDYWRDLTTFSAAGQGEQEVRMPHQYRDVTTNSPTAVPFTARLLDYRQS